MTDERSAREAMLQSMARMEEKVENLGTRVLELKGAIEEMVDRMDADVDALRTKQEPIGIIQATQAEHARRLGLVEDKADTINLKIAFASGVVAVLSVLLKLVWK